MFGTRVCAAVEGTDIAKTECPSAGCIRTSLAAIVLTPPGRFSTITRQPSDSDTSLARMRLMMSGGVLAELGATIRMVADGKGFCWASATVPAVTQANTVTGVSIRRIEFCNMIKLLNVGRRHSRLIRQPPLAKTACIPECGMLRSALRNANDVYGS